MAGPVGTMDVASNLTEQKLDPAQCLALNDFVPPNKGTELIDFKAVGPDSESQDEFRKQRGIDKSKQIKLVKISHMRYQHPDLNKITTYLLDFGMKIVKRTDSEIWFGGYGPDQYIYYARVGSKKQFLGGSFLVESHDELKKVLELPNVRVLSNGIEEMKDAPGGGYIVTIEDPEGFPVNFVYGIQEKPVEEKPEKLIPNFTDEKKRQRKFHRFEAGPAACHKLGHFGIVVNDFQKEMQFYIQNFNIIPSDVLYISIPGGPQRVEVTMFGHIDRGTDLVDHHTFFLAAAQPGGKHHVHHSSFEVHDFDTQHLGHQWLAKKGYESVWGIGRHILGSQIFDYWWDVHGNMMEHYADGDLVNSETPVGYGPAGHESLAVWGPEVPKAFLD